MISLGVDQFILAMAAVMMILGVISMAAGILVLVFRVSSKDVQKLADQTVRLAQKGIAEEVSGLVGNASALLDALNQLVRTTTGVGVFLVIVGFFLFAGSFYLIQQL
ncbi:MAG: hypothetical protein HY835_08700 [Anaerolineae bacterium]|nr:hypothetical protein [Anaerolineae bacterium]